VGNTAGLPGDQRLRAFLVITLAGADPCSWGSAISRRDLEEWAAESSQWRMRPEGFCRDVCDRTEIHPLASPGRKLIPKTQRGLIRSDPSPGPRRDELHRDRGPPSPQGRGLFQFSLPESNQRRARTSLPLLRSALPLKTRTFGYWVRTSSSESSAATPGAGAAGAGIVASVGTSSSGRGGSTSLNNLKFR